MYRCSGVPPSLPAFSFPEYTYVILHIFTAKEHCGKEGAAETFMGWQRSVHVPTLAFAPPQHFRGLTTEPQRPPINHSHHLLQLDVQFNLPASQFYFKHYRTFTIYFEASEHFKSCVPLPKGISPFICKVGARHVRSF